MIVIKHWFPVLVLTCSCFCRGDDPITFDQAMQKQPEKFPLLELKTHHESGKAQPMKLALNGKDSFIFNGTRYSGFRFVPDRKEGHKEDDFLWYWTDPVGTGLQAWGIAKVEGRVNGFERFWRLNPKLFPALKDWPPEQKRWIILQSIHGKNLVDGDEYIIWFRFSETDTQPVEFTAAAGFFPKADVNRGYNSRVLSLLGLEMDAKAVSENFHLLAP